ncbi:MAG: hypothetical protein GY832_05220 [Chloroflexi bacterium]|nr:hypothetical protein [Chloroflexota bacterium]
MSKLWSQGEAIPPATLPNRTQDFQQRKTATNQYKQPDYKEARVRAEFIDPFLEVLGWDVRNVQGRGV